MSQTTRRQFLKTSSAVGGSLILTGTRASGAVDGASERVRIAVAGLNGRGQSHLKGWMGQSNVEVAYVIDPDERVRANAMNGLEKRTEGPFNTKDGPGRARGAGRQVAGRDLNRHAKSLAFANDDLGGSGGQTRLR